MRKLIYLLLFTLIALATATEAQAAPPFVGSWSNGRGEELVITAKTIRAGKGPAFAYQDVTGVTDGNNFKIKLAGDARKFNTLSRFMMLSLKGKKSMKTMGADTLAGLDNGPTSEVNWER